MLGGLAGVVGLLMFAASGHHNIPSPTYSSSPPVTYSSPSYSSSSSTYQPPTQGFGTGTTTTTTIETARPDAESAPVMFPVAAETLPVSKKAPPVAAKVSQVSVPVGAAHSKTLSKTAASPDGTTPAVLSPGLAEFSPDGRVVAYLDSEAVVRVWSLAKHRVIRSLAQSKDHPPVDIRFSPDAKTLALTYGNQGDQKSANRITVWNLATGKSQGTLKVNAEKEWLAAGAMLADGRVIVARNDSVSGKERLSLWDPRTGKEGAVPMKGVSDKGVFDVYDVGVSADGKQMVSGDKTGHIRWWDARTGAQKAEKFPDLTYRDFKDSPFYASNLPEGVILPDGVGLSDALPVESLRLSNNGSYVASRNAMRITVYDAKGSEVGDVPVGYAPAFAVSPDGKWVAEGGGWKNPEQNTLCKVQGGDQIRLQALAGQVKAWSFSPDGQGISGLLASPDGVSLLTWRTGDKPLAPFAATRSLPLWVPVSPSGSKQVISLSKGLYALQSGQRLEIRRLDGSFRNTLDQGSSPFTEVNFSRNGHFLCGQTAGGETQLWDVNSGRQVAQLPAMEPVQDGTSQALWYRSSAIETPVFSPDNSLLARAGSVAGKNGIEVWSLGKTPRRIASLPLKQPLSVLHLAADNRSLFIGEASGKLTCYDVPTGKLRAQIQNGPAPITQLVATKRGLAVVSDSSAQEPATLVTLYEMPSNGPSANSAAGQNRRAFKKKGQMEMENLSYNVDSLAISPDGQFVAAATQIDSAASGVSYSQPKNAIGIWHLPTGSLLQKLPVETSGNSAVRPNTSQVDTVSFSPDGTQLHCTNRDTRGGPQQVLSWTCPTQEKPAA